MLDIEEKRKEDVSGKKESKMMIGFG